ncbi:hypothetical protein GCM10011365_25170 [Marinicella pacifica]|jgi:Fe2+ or Zn2+ uptake regulation protein|uniref:Uncharacterized protein n=1 Tax=Marinicella pacifica TaxID=1171543 RepID=A0A917FS21_9GAMM|nr:hypothetical protein [Marinicella pacifica]GGG02954.1 hypothetical protein GCM10011365_25170 [Marinicella pacifica]
MKKNQKFILECADCKHLHRKSFKWLENTHHFICDGCDTELDIDEIVDEIYDKPEQERFKIYPR